MNAIIVLTINTKTNDVQKVFTYPDNKKGQKLAQEKFMRLCRQNDPEAISEPRLQQMLKNGFQYFQSTGISVSYVYSSNDDRTEYID